MAFDVKYIIELIDKFSPEAKNIVVMQKNITINMEKMAEKTKKVTSKFERLRGELKKVGRTLLTHVSLPLGVAAVAAIHQTKSFEQSIATIKSVTGATVPVISALKKHILELGASNRISAIKIADAEAEMSRYHLTLTQIDKLMGQSIPFATANMRDGIIDIHSASTIAVRALRGLGLPMKALPEFLKSITAASHASGLTISEFAQTLKYLDTPMRALKVPYKDVIALAGVYALAMKHGGMGAREARSMFRNLKSPMKDLSHEFKVLGIRVFDAHGKFLGMEHLFKVMSDTFDSAPKMTGQAADAMNVIIQSGIKGWKSMRENVDKTKLQNKLYNDQNNNLAGSIDKLNNSIQSLSISMVEAQLGPLQNIIDSMQQFILRGLGMSDATKGMIAGMWGLLTVLGPVVVSLGIFLSTLKYLGILPVITGYLASFGATFVAVLGSPFILFAAGIALASVALWKFLNLFSWGRKVTKFLADDFSYLIHHPLKALENMFESIGNKFEWLYHLISGKPLKIDASVSGQATSPSVSQVGSLASYIGGGTQSQQRVHSTMDVNVFDPQGYIKSISSTSQQDGFNVALGENMSYSR